MLELFSGDAELSKQCSLSINNNGHWPPGLLKTSPSLYSRKHVTARVVCDSKKYIYI